MPIIDIHDLVTNRRKSQKLHFEIVTLCLVIFINLMFQGFVNWRFVWCEIMSKYEKLKYNGNILSQYSCFFFFLKRQSLNFLDRSK
jgi:hypothetical protein